MPRNTVVLVRMPELKPWLGTAQRSGAGSCQLWEQSSGISAVQTSPVASADAWKPSANTAFLNNEVLQAITHCCIFPREYLECSDWEMCYLLPCKVELG